MVDVRRFHALPGVCGVRDPPSESSPGTRAQGEWCISSCLAAARCSCSIDDLRFIPHLRLLLVCARRRDLKYVRLLTRPWVRPRLSQNRLHTAPAHVEARTLRGIHQ